MRYSGPDRCPVCDDVMHSWLHLRDHAEELYQRAINPDDRVIVELRRHGCIVNPRRQLIAVEGPIA